MQSFWVKGSVSLFVPSPYINSHSDAHTVYARRAARTPFHPTGVPILSNPARGASPLARIDSINLTTTVFEPYAGIGATVGYLVPVGQFSVFTTILSCRVTYSTDGLLAARVSFVLRVEYFHHSSSPRRRLATPHPDSPIHRARLCTQSSRCRPARCSASMCSARHLVRYPRASRPHSRWHRHLSRGPGPATSTSASLACAFV